MSCEFYYDDIFVTSFINIRYGNIPAEIIQQGTALLFICSGQKDLAQMPFCLRWVQYMVTNILQDQQYPGTC